MSAALGVGNAEPTVAFGVFYAKLLEEGGAWAADKFYIGKISVGPSAGRDRSGSAAAVWEAQVVRCDRVDEINGENGGNGAKVCTGEARRAMMAAANVVGVKSGFTLGEKETFYGTAVRPEEIRVGLEDAQAKTDEALGGGRGGNYVYELTVRRSDNVPIWRITRDCGSGPDSDVCRDEERWTAEISAATGEIISRSR